ncbi:unnamed protein product [Arctogadus glacialis]
MKPPTPLAPHASSPPRPWVCGRRRMPFWRCVGGITTEDFIGRLKQTQGRVEAGGVVLTGLTGTTDQWGTTPECSGVQARPRAYQH